VVGGSEQLQPAGPEEVPAGELERLATVRLVPGGRVAPVPDLGSVYAQDPDRFARGVGPRDPDRVAVIDPDRGRVHQDPGPGRPRRDCPTGLPPGATRKP